MVNYSPSPDQNGGGEVLSYDDVLVKSGQLLSKHSHSAPRRILQLGEVPAGHTPRTFVGRANIWLWRYIPIITAVTALLTIIHQLISLIMNVIRP